MAKETVNYGLIKPEENDYYDIEVQNGNMDLIDTALHNRATKAVPAAAGNLAGLDADGSLHDSGVKPSDFASAEDIVAINASLANKARLYTSFESLGMTEAAATVENIVTAMENGSILAAGCTTIAFGTGLVPDTYGLLRVHKRSSSYVMWEYGVVGYSGRLWRGYYNGGYSGDKWSSWGRIATATPATEYNVPFASGYADRGQVNEGIYTSKYSKDQFGRVFVQIAVQKDPYAVTIQGSVVVATLPAGYRPQRNAVAAAFANESTSKANILIRPDGSITVYSSDNTGFIHGQISFLVAP